MKEPENRRPRPTGQEETHNAYVTLMSQDREFANHLSLSIHVPTNGECAASEKELNFDIIPDACKKGHAAESKVKHPPTKPITGR